MLRDLLRDGWSSLLAAVLPVECAGCGQPDVPLCGGCASRLAGPSRVVPSPPVPGCPPVRAVAVYEATPRAVLVAWKDHGRYDLSAVLARALAAAVSAGPLPAGLLLVPVPSSRAAVRRRGEDLVADLARRAAARLRASGADITARAVLTQRRGVRDQAALGAGERAANLQGALRVRPAARLRGVPCVLVDDVVTTGATLSEAARVVTDAGAAVLGAAVIAATPRRLPVTRRDEPREDRLGYRVSAEWSSVSTWQASPRE